MERNQLRYSIDGSGIASNLTALLDRKRLENQGEFEQADELLRKEKISETAVISNFVRRCSSDDVVKAECQVDKDSEGRVSEGITTYSVQTKTSQLITIGIHENNYASCKDQMAVLGSAVQKAKEKIKNKKEERKRKIAGGTLAVVGAAIVILAGKYVLEDHGIIGTKGNDTSITTEAPVEDTTEYATPIDATTESSLEDKYDAETIRAGMEKSNKEEFDKEMEELKQRRIDLGLNPDPLTPVTNESENVNSSTNSDNEFHSSYGYNDVYENAENTQKAIDEFNEYETQRQKEALEELRKSYEEEYKVKTY